MNLIDIRLVKCHVFNSVIVEKHFNDVNDFILLACKALDDCAKVKCVRVGGFGAVLLHCVAEESKNVIRQNALEQEHEGVGLVNAPCACIITVYESIVVILDGNLAQVKEQGRLQVLGNSGGFTCAVVLGNEFAEGLVEELNKLVALAARNVLDVVEIHLDVLLEKCVDVALTDDCSEQTEKAG